MPSSATTPSPARDIIIVSLASWSRTSSWWRHALHGLEAREAPASWRLLMRHFLAGRGADHDCGALSTAEAEIIRGWAAGIPGWRERAERGQFPLRFRIYQGVGEALGDATTRSAR